MKVGRAALAVFGLIALALCLTVCVNAGDVKETRSATPRAVDADSGSLAVYVADSESGSPLQGAVVFARGPYWWKDSEHSIGFQTDSTGWAQIAELESGNYEVRACHWTHGRDTGMVFIRAGRSDTLRFRLPYLGAPHDGRRCEMVGAFQLDSTRVRKP